MYNLVAFTYKADLGSQEIVDKCLAFLEKSYKLYNIPNHRVEDLLKENTVVVTFGKFSELAVQHFVSEKKLLNIRHEKLPHPKQLIKSETNQDYRTSAFEVLKKIKDFLEHDIYIPEIKKIREEDLPDLDKRQIQMLKKIVEEDKKDSCYQMTKNGKLLEVGAVRRPDSKAEAFLTFEELFTLRLLMDVFKTEVELVSSNPIGSAISATKKDST